MVVLQLLVPNLKLMRNVPWLELKLSQKLWNLLIEYGVNGIILHLTRLYTGYFASDLATTKFQCYILQAKPGGGI